MLNEDSLMNTFHCEAEFDKKKLFIKANILSFQESAEKKKKGCPHGSHVHTFVCKIHTIFTNLS